MESYNTNTTFGAAFIGFGCSCVLLGTLCSQMYHYFRRYPQDRTFYKCLVAVLWLLEVVDSVFIAYAVYFYLKLGQSSRFDHARPMVTLGATAGAIVKACFAMRVWRFSNNNIVITTVILLLTFGQLAMACVYTVQSFKIDNLTKLADLKVIGTISLGMGVATDVVTALALCYFLRNLRTGYSKDDSLVNRLTLYALNTGVVTSAISLTTVVLYDIMPENFIFMGFYFVLSKLYANSFLATLNTRRVVRGRGTDAENTTMPTFLMVDKATRYASQQDLENTVGTFVEVGVHREVSIHKDYESEYATAA
ncbi:hypothetical protein DAEQUDRAFT_761828 [Daedalea quercina L-15889]|uniref:DUF6534 domain-containing protein n=1 Tax=Daedalea quercina L-15889 TaxID=1314783 RepID=A0A165TSE2_9APHY|nr:hypothetical protein DAEQUDRAFT_761828 [Daedalea quercina L-15889]